MRFADLALKLLGSTSGEQIVRAAATASGAITLPAGTTDFSSTGGTGQVIKQATAGGAFTVGTVAGSELSGTVAVANGGTGATTGAAGPYLPLAGGTVGGQLHVDTGSNQLWLHGSASVAAATVYAGTFHEWNVAVQGASGEFWFYDLTAGAARLIIDAGGNCKNTTGTWSAVSDRRLKRNISPYERGLAAIRRLDPVSFEYDGRGGLPTGQTYYGLIADDVELVMPELIGEHSLEIDGRETSIKTVDPGRIVYALINAVQELAARVEALEARVA